MKNIYKITKGQLISLWVFGVIAWIYEIDSYSDISKFLTISIPAILVFYTLGWKSFNKKEKIGESKEDFKIKNLIPIFKKTIKPLITVLFVVGLIFSVSKLSEARKEKVRQEQLTQDYNQVILKIDLLREQVATCIKPAYERIYKEEERDCNLLRNKVKADYDMCLTYTSVSPRASCLYDYDYEKIDCSKESILKKARLGFHTYDIPTSCSALVNELEKSNSIIKEYSELNKK